MIYLRHTHPSGENTNYFQRKLMVGRQSHVQARNQGAPPTKHQAPPLILKKT